MRTIPQRELRNNVAQILRDEEFGQSIRVTVGGRPVADLIPITPRRRVFVPRAEILDLLAGGRFDHALARDVESVLGATIDDL